MPIGPLLRAAETRIFAAPWKTSNALWRWLAYPRLRLLFAVNGIAWGRGWRLFGAPIVQKYRGSLMQFGDGLSLRSATRANPMAPNHPVVLATLRPDAVLSAGARFAMTGGCLCAAELVQIGDDVVVGANAIIVDTDFHPLEAGQRLVAGNDGMCAPTIIEDGVFVGMNAMILKGSRIGRCSVIGAGSVVSGEIPAGVVAAGNPARVIRELVPAREEAR